MIATRLPLKDFVHLQQTNKKFWEHLSQLMVFQKLLAARKITDPYTEMLQSLEHLNLYEEVKATGLLEENRIGFAFGGTAIFYADYEHERQETDVKGSRDRIDRVKALLRKYPQLTVRVDGHCGTAAPNEEVAVQFSVFRASVVIDEFEEFMSESSERTRLIMRAWGKRVTEAASTSDHKYAPTARDGKGWVEIRIGILGNEDFQVPVEPSFYEGIEAEDIVMLDSDDEDGEASDEDDEDGEPLLEVIEDPNINRVEEEDGAGDDSESEAEDNEDRPNRRRRRRLR